MEHGSPKVKAVIKTLDDLGLIIPTFAEALDNLRDLKLGEEEWADNAGTISRFMSLYYDATCPPEHFAPQEQ
eukprot:11870513-Heterocapsa_arctica.AAC.1